MNMHICSSSRNPRSPAFTSVARKLVTPELKRRRNPITTLGADERDI